MILSTSKLSRDIPPPEAPRASFDWALRWSLVPAACYVLLRMLSLLSGNHDIGPVDFAWLFGSSFLFFLLVFFPLRLWWQSRAIQEKSFSWFGLGATFFGLGMLIFFFAALLYQATGWFRLMPERIEARNRFLLNRVENAEENARAEMAKVEKEYAEALAQAVTKEEKQELRVAYEDEKEGVIPDKRRLLQRDIEDYQKELERGYRGDTSPLGVFLYFLTQGTSSEPQDAAIYYALFGSLWLVAITILFAVPVGVGAALYLEEYRSTSWLGQVIQININNLAGVPSVVYGILGGFVFVWFFHQVNHHYPWIAARNVIGGGLTLGLLTLPVVIVSAQEAIRAVPMSIRHGAYALGATRWQVIWHQVLPPARPGILTGTILALSRAMGEAAPLVLFGALQFVNQEPGLFSPFTVLPMQIYDWASRPDTIWQYNAAMASLVLLFTLLSINAVAIYLRYRAQRQSRW